MLSHLFRITDAFRRTHGYSPNLLYLNPRHHRWLRASLAGLKTEAEMSRILGMDILIVSEIEHPDVAWTARPEVNGAEAVAH